jgi:hypothetical protein
MTMPDRASGHGRRPIAATALVGAVLAGIAGAGCTAGTSDGKGDLTDRRAEVAERGGDVMPFDLDATTHRFDPTGTGLVQTVVADDPDDAAEIALVREHLRHESERFRGGDYSDPAAIHGEDMPGLSELEAGAARIVVNYTDEPAGGGIKYTTADAALVTALHDWAAAQTTDHGDHADSSHAGG